MRKPLLIAVITIAVVAAGVVWRLTDKRARAPNNGAPDVPAAIDAVSPAPSVDGRPPVTSEAERDRVLDAYFEPLRFRDEVTAFLDTVPQRSTAENARALQSLSRRIRDYQQAGYLALPQARYLEGALISAVYRDDEAARLQALENLRAEYAARAEPPSTAHLDARFETYKAREAEIVRDVLDNPPPEGMTRDAWLRGRLDALRAEVYGDQ